jgi:hypothetical protein
LGWGQVEVGVEHDGGLVARVEVLAEWAMPKSTR